ncbi:MAG: CRTAC1 family protein [Acidobacteria bacterium]|nr:CRTAC1 family protein [Acidobacteriota bacterium]
MPYSRRDLLALFFQGVASRGVKPQPKGKPSGLPFKSRFTDVAAAAGLTAPVIYGGVDRKDYLLETTGSGVAFLDYDNDGWLDLFIPSGARFGTNPPEAINRLYKNNRDGTFTDVTMKAGLARQGWACGVAVADYNNDGFEDIFVSYWGQNVLYRNNGDGTFTDVTKEAGLVLPGRHWTTGCTFVDTNRDGHLDLFLSTYVDFDPARIPKPGQNPNCNWKGIPVNCGPRGLTQGRFFLFRNNGKGVYSDVTKAAGLGEARAYGLTAIAADFDEDGWPDLYAACDSVSSVYFRNKRDGTFEEEALPRGVAVNEDGMEQAGMGLGVGDYNLDGHLDLFKTHFSDDTHILYRNDGQGNFTDTTKVSGLGVETRYVGWGAGIVDLDNDGRPDLFVASGAVYPEIEAKLPSYPFKNPRIIFRALPNGSFEELIDEAGPGIAAAHSSRGCAFGDFDNDGDVDILIMNMNEPVSLLRNDGDPAANWLKVLLTGTKSNRSAIGAQVRVRYGGRVQVQEVLSQSSYLSVNDRRLHFGLGAVKTADVEIRWPSGARQTLAKVEANHLLLVNETGGITGRLRPPFVR